MPMCYLAVLTLEHISANQQQWFIMMRVVFLIRNIILQEKSLHYYFTISSMNSTPLQLMMLWKVQYFLYQLGLIHHLRFSHLTPVCNHLFLLSGINHNENYQESINQINAEQYQASKQRQCSQNSQKRIRNRKCYYPPTADGDETQKN